MTDIAQSIFEAIDIIVDKKLHEADFTTAVVGKILSAKTSRIYVVKYQDMTFEAEALSSLDLKRDDVVYILMPKNDLAAKKYIVGKTSGDTPYKEETSGGGGTSVTIEYATIEDINSLFNENS